MSVSHKSICPGMYTHVYLHSHHQFCRHECVDRNGTLLSPCMILQLFTQAHSCGCRGEGSTPPESVYVFELRK